MYTNLLFIIIAAYLLGSVPFGLIIAKSRGRDLRKIGSGNIGATNVSRALGKKWGYFCFLLDVLKGLVPMIIAGKVISSEPDVTEFFLWLITGCAAVIGHIFPVYLRFKGGKGVATSFGVALGLWPYYTICSLLVFAIWLIVVSLWRYVSLASIVASVAFPTVLFIAIAVWDDWNLADLWPLLTAAIAIPVLVTIRHRENIKRLMAGTESKILTK